MNGYGTLVSGWLAVLERCTYDEASWRLGCSGERNTLSGEASVGMVVGAFIWTFMWSY